MRLANVNQSYANVDIVNLAFRLLSIEQNNIDDLKYYV